MTPPPTNRTPTVILDGLVFPEGPRWHGGRLWFSDMHGHRVISVEADGINERVEADFEEAPSGLGFLPDDSLLVAGMSSRCIWRVDPEGHATLHADLSSYPGEFLNDMVVDADGRAYVGCRSHRRRGAPPPDDMLIAVEPDGRSWVAADHVVGPNGSTLSPDGSTLILAETQAKRVTAFDRSPTGHLSGRRNWADLEPYFPDGMCLDADGCLWIGTAIGRSCLRVAEGGEILDRIDYDKRWPVACVLGGNERRTLLLCTAEVTLAGLQRVSELSGPPEAVVEPARRHCVGHIEAVDVDVAGIGTP